MAENLVRGHEAPRWHPSALRQIRMRGGCDCRGAVDRHADHGPGRRFPKSADNAAGLESLLTVAPRRYNVTMPQRFDWAPINDGPRRETLIDYNQVGRMELCHSADQGLHAAHLNVW